MDWRTAIGVAARRNGLRLHIGSGSMNDDKKRNANQCGTSRGVGVGFKMPGAREAILLMRQGLGMIMCVRRGKNDRDAEINQRQRQAENLLTHGR
jgi:hypothetical protein